MEYVATSLEEYFSIIMKINEDTSSSAFYHDVADMRSVYRGHGDKTWRLEPSGLRSIKRIRNERLYLKEFRRQLPNETDGLDLFDILVKAQHYGVPTRLLDFTLNPLVALYFACTSEPNKDGAVICLTNQGLLSQEDLSVQTLMHYIFKLKHGLYWDDRFNNLLYNSLAKDPDIYHYFTTETLIKILSSETPLFVAARLTNSRIQVQDGVFALFNTPLSENFRTDTSNAFEAASEFKIDQKERLKEISIPHTAKLVVLRQLDLIGINDAYLFPELEIGLRTIVKRIDQTNDRYQRYLMTMDTEKM